MSWYLVLFGETGGSDINSECFSVEHMIEANSPKQAVKKLLATFFDCYGEGDDDENIKDILSNGAIVIELGTVKPKIKRIGSV